MWKNGTNKISNFPFMQKCESSSTLAYVIYMYVSTSTQPLLYIFQETLWLFLYPPLNTFPIYWSIA